MSYVHTLPQIVTDRNKIQVGAINLLLELDLMEGYTPLDVSSASKLDFILQKPDGTFLTYPALFRTDGTDGKVYHLTIAGDLPIEGDYYMQTYIEMPSFKGYSTPVKFTVYENIPVTADF
jgi:hypothetical protein